MGWVYIDDNYHENSKIVRAGGDAELLWIRGLAYCNRRYTEGRIEKNIVPRLSDRKNPMKLAERLTDVGLWVPVDDDFYEVHEYEEWNHSAAKKAKARKAAKVRWHGANADAQASAEHVPKDMRDPMPDPMLDDALRAPGKAFPHPPITLKEPDGSLEKPLALLAEGTPVAHREVFDAVLAACAIEPAGITESARGGYGKAASEIRKAGGTSEDVLVRAVVYRTKFPQAALTPSALAKHWAECGEAGASVPAISDGQAALARARLANGGAA